MANKVMFGVSNLHIGTYSVSTTGTVTLGTPYALPGTVNISMEPEGDLQEFYADNIVYWSGYSDNGYSGSIENALFPDDFKTKFLGYLSKADGGIAQVRNAKKPQVYLAFQAEGDEAARRGIFYNVSLGNITREYATTEDSIEPATASLPFRVNGDAKTGIVKVGYPYTTSGAYTTIFTTPPVPSTT